MGQNADHREQIYRKNKDVTWARRLTDHREQIYRKSGDVTWARRLTTESKSIGKVGTSNGPEG